MVEEKTETKEKKVEFSKYERARILGARGLQVSMDAPILVKMSEEDLNGVNYDPLRIAEKELDSGVLPISVNRPLPERHEEDLEKIKIVDKDVSDEAKIKAEKEGEKEIAEGGEIMELANPEDEQEGSSGSSNE
jgi:DNA-directed RNA polymerase subunit K/omega